jgi:hypothetical protein
MGLGDVGWFICFNKEASGNGNANSGSVKNGDFLICCTPGSFPDELNYMTLVFVYKN